MPNLKRSRVPYPSYYAFTLIAKYLGDRDSRIFEGDANDTICLGCVKGSDGHYCILVVNSGDEQREISINIKEALNRNFYRHMYSSAAVIPNSKAEIIGIDKTFEKVGNVLSDILPANSMAIYTTRMD